MNVTGTCKSQISCPAKIWVDEAARTCLGRLLRLAQSLTGMKLEYAQELLTAASCDWNDRE